MRRQTAGSALFLLIFWLAGWLSSPDLSRAASSSPNFDTAVKPILEKYCQSCHSSESHQSGLVLDSVPSILQGGALHGAAVIPGKSQSSSLIAYLRGEKKPQMPLSGSPLSEEEISTIAEWIDQLEPSSQDQKSKSLGWPWTRLEAPSIPDPENHSWVKNPIDAFILAKQEKNGLHPAPPASSRALLRRVYFDLIGLPPSPEAMARFLKNPGEEAYEAEIEKLLSDPRYGERWARHWLDLVRYAESQGGGVDRPRPQLWRYRDYVIRAFNQDRPYDRFIREQIAGDGYPGYGSEGRIALGFLNLTLTLEGTGPKLRRVRLTDIVDTVGSAFLGITLQCAQCHDHKYDPIPTRDYYRMEAFFAPVILGPTPVPFTQYEKPEKLKKQAKEWEALLAKRTEWREKIKSKFRNRIQKARTPMAFQDRKDMVLPIRDEDLRAFVEKGILFSKEEQELYKLVRRQEPQAFANPNHPDRYEPIAFSAREQLGGSNPMVPATYILKGGQMDSRGDLVEPGLLSAATGSPKPVELTGTIGTRRKLLAEWIASPENPLTARVMVNRIWQHHFGKGLVESPSDFGKNGSGTVHPELLDWMATQFIEHRWSIKAMHRLMLKSNTYRQSLRNPKLNQFEPVDPENKYLWSMNTIRLEGEAIRDSLLALSGQLNPERGGPGFFPQVDDELLRRAGTWWEPSPRKERNRRSIYMIQQRVFTHPFIRVFDGASANEMCAARQVTTVTPQAFALSNSKFVRDQSRFMAERIRKEAGADLKSQVERAFQLAFQRSPTAFEEENILAALNPSGAEAGELPTPPGTHPGAQLSSVSLRDNQPPGPTAAKAGALSLAELCLVLFNMNELIFLE